MLHLNNEELLRLLQGWSFRSLKLKIKRVDSDH